MVLSAAWHSIAQLIPSIVHAVILPPLLAFIVSGALVALLVRSRVAVFALDHPNQRSLHSTPTPRLGGIGIVAGTAAAWCYAMPVFEPMLLLALGLLIGVSLLDDLQDVAVGWRMTTHLASAALAVTAVLQGHELWQMALAAIATAWMINLYNFMDGADGLAGGMAVIGFGCYGIAALAGGDFSFAATNLSVAAAALGFLLFNFPPARIFMGDIGAIPLGCLAAVFNVAGWLRSDWPWWFGIVIFSPFIIDASVTLAKRLLRGARIWRAHREHYYQRLVQSGWGHRRTAYAEYALMLSCSLIAIAGMRLGETAQTALLGIVALLYTVLVIALEHHFAGHVSSHADS
jgi:UDP-N-acetylmuramyl pentapeptide phosphotransferase/UDP-N-acetylglucosamine-1-phosphate transferase